MTVFRPKNHQNSPKSIKIRQNPYYSRIRKSKPKSRKFQKFKIPGVRAEHMRASGSLFGASMASMDSLLVLLQTDSTKTTSNPSFPHRFGAKKTKIKLPQWKNKGFPYKWIPKIRLFQNFRAFRPSSSEPPDLFFVHQS